MPNKDPNRREPTPKELSDALKIEATCLLSMLRETVTELDNLKEEEQYLARMTQHYQRQIDSVQKKQNPD